MTFDLIQTARRQVAEATFAALGRPRSYLFNRPE